ncbi:MAG: M1 family metallopeptidase [Flavobacteriales bacterium]|nr:M1 family metallopeptidase [Flavobacteriales bacterium]
MNKLIFAALLLLVVYGCRTTGTINLPERIIEIENPDKKPVERPIYQASYTKKVDLIHTKLAVSFNWEKAELYGKADIILRPYFYATNNLELNARGMDIHQVALVENGNKKPLDFTYDSLLITIALDKNYTRNDTLTIFIDYTAKPDDLKTGGSNAISSDKGLYFINPKGEEKNKMPQIWTQGETESNSVWFPTVDASNQKMTNEIAITVAEKYATLSNGILINSELNGNGTRTDFWEMNQPHAPYLVMMAIGEYKVVKDKWRNIEVNYYVEEAFEPYAKDIFGLTPEMIEFYSNILGVDYPWQKYHQVVVRDYVSGAMENTSAVIFGDFVYQTKREMIDGSSGEDVIAHELFHHWFGDLVTCESWSNLPLNESFATYSEFLWNEYKHGNDKAAHGLQQDLSGYLSQAKQTGPKDMIRFDYEDKEDMFDGHSYQKGGRILHMLRKYMGDEAFFASLKLYLDENKYTDVEMHQLRLACEKVTGEDLNWFFNQWFFAKGHPVLEINYEYNDSTKTQKVIVEQKQNFEEVPLYKLPFKIDIYANGKKETKEVVVDKVMNVFEFEASSKPDLVNVDADKMLLCEKTDNHKSTEEWAFLYQPTANYGALKMNYLDKYEAISKLQKSKEEIAITTLIKALNDEYEGIRNYALGSIKTVANAKPIETKEALLKLAKEDTNSKVRGNAIGALAKYFAGEDGVEDVFLNGINEQSYFVIGKSLAAISTTNGKLAMKYAKTFEEEDNATLVGAVSGIYVEHGTEKQLDYFMNKAEKIDGFGKYGFMMSFNSYLKKQDNATVSKGLTTIKEVALNEKIWWIRMLGINSLSDLDGMYSNRIHIAEAELKTAEVGSEKEQKLKNSIDEDKKLQQAISKILEEVKTKEENPRLRSMLGLK